MQVRACLQDLTRKSVSKLKSLVPGGSVSDVVQYMSDQLIAAQCEKLSPGARSVNLWLTASSASDVQRWTAMNNSASLTTQTSFCTVVAACVKKLGWNESSPDSRQSLPLADLVWTCTDAIFDEIPAAVPSLALACVLKFAGETENGTEGTDAVPSFCHFLCVSQTEEIVDEAPAI